MQVAEAKLDVSQPAPELRVAVPRRAGDRCLRRQGRRNQPCAADLRGARYTGGLWVGKFLKTCTWQRLTAEGTRAVAPAIEAICEAENMLGHGVTATMRLERVGV